MEAVRFGIVGLGAMGLDHAKTILERVPEAELCAVATRNPAHAQQIRELPGGQNVRVFESPEAMYASGAIEAVLIATPHRLHVAQATQAFEAGVHVLLEKPMGVCTQEVRALNEAADRSGKAFGAMFNVRTHPAYVRMKQIVDSGELGEIRRTNVIITDWFRAQSYYDSGDWRATWDGEGGGVLLNQCPHQLDLLQWICGLPKKVQAFCHEGHWHDIEVEDDVTAYLEYENGATGVFVTSTGDAPGTNRFEVDLEWGKLVCENNKLLLYKLSENEREFCKTAKGGFDSPECHVEEVETDGENPQHVGVLNAFAANILHGTPLVARGEEGIRGLTLSNAMHLSSWLHHPVEIPFDEDLYLEELNKRRKTSRKKEATDVTFDTTGSY